MSKLKIYWIAITTLIVLLSTLLFKPVSADTVLNRLREGHQYLPSICCLSNEKLAVSWYSESPFLPGIKMKLFTSNLVPCDDDENFVPQLAYLGLGPALLASSDSFFIAAFARYSNWDLTNLDIYVRKFDNNGNALSGDIRVNSDTLGDQLISSLIVDNANSNILVAWRSVVGETPDQCNLLYRHLNFNLELISNDISIYNYTDVPLAYLGIALISPTKLMAIWNDDYSGIAPRVMGRTMDIDGSNPSSVFQVHTTNDGEYFEPSIVGLQSEGALVTWSANFDVYEASIWGKRYLGSGDPLDEEEWLLSFPDSNGDGESEVQGRVRAIQDPASQKICVSWDQALSGSPGRFKCMARFFNGSLQPFAEPQRAGETEGDILNPVGTFLNADSSVLCWQGQFGGYYFEDIVGSLVAIPQTAVRSDNDPSLGNCSTAYPNPCNRSSIVEFSLPQASEVNITLFNVLGQLVMNTKYDQMPSGLNKAIIDFSGMGSGIYFCLIKANNIHYPLKVTLLK